MRKLVCIFVVLVFCCGLISGCANKQEPKIGVSLGVGTATRWEKEERYMKAYAEKVGAKIEVRRNLTDAPKTQKQDCEELIDSGIDVLIFTPRDVEKTDEINYILSYAKKKKVKVINYARAIMGERVDIFIGYDSEKLGEQMGEFLVEKTRGDYIIMRGPSADNNARVIYNGAMKVINKYTTSANSEEYKINIVADFEVEGWSQEKAAQLLEQTLAVHRDVKGVLAPNDKLAEATVKVLIQKGYTTENMPIITGMDAELAAVKRIVEGKQAMTICMDFKKLAEKAVETACNYAKGEKVVANDKLDNQSEEPIDAILVAGDVVTKNNIKTILIDREFYTYEEIYG